MAHEDDIGAAVSGLDVGLRLLGAVLGGGALGLVIDRWMGWGPWLMLAGIFGGFITWLVNAARRKNV